ncbi:MAG: amidohydrolase [Vicinamibacteria bacterium]|nr:amidohydrolase [Vicinamibacteria bacterium]
MFLTPTNALLLLLAVDAPDRILVNGVVHTMDDAHPMAQAVAMTAGRISAVGSTADLMATKGPRTEVIDLLGATVVPGLKESHGHFVGIGQARMTLNLVGTKSWEEVVARVAVAVKARPKGAWIVGRGWHEGKWETKPQHQVRGFPSHDELSAVSPDNPVYLVRADGHAGFANAQAISMMKITKETKPPTGGDIIRDESGQATGVFIDKAQGLIRPPGPTEGDVREAIRLATEECLRKGITFFDDAGEDLSTIAIYKDLAAKNQLGLRLHAMIRGLDNLKRFGPPQPGGADSFLSIRSLKLSIDGALGSRGAKLLEPYVDDPGNTGLWVTDPAVVSEAALYGIENGFQVNVHAIGDAGNRAVLDAFEAAFKAHPEKKDVRFRDEHSQILDEKEIPRFGKLGVIASIQGIHATSDLPWAAERLGEPRVLEGAYVWQKLKKSGAVLINGTDAPVEDVDPIKSFYATVTRQSETGVPAGGYQPDQRLTRLEALRSYTKDAYWASFAEKFGGTIEPGKWADLTVLSNDLLSVPDSEILSTKVLYTIVNGNIAYRSGWFKKLH